MGTPEVAMDPIESILDTKGRELHVTSPDATVLDAVETMCAAHVGALLVMEGDALVGVFSERDLMTRVVLARKSPEETKVGEVMTSDVAFISVDTTPGDVMRKMTHSRIRHLPVVHGARVVGLVSIGDLVRWTVRDREREIDRLEHYVAGRYPG
jgi:CBS domain-containing protein